MLKIFTVRGIRNVCVFLLWSCITACGPKYGTILRGSLAGRHVAWNVMTKLKAEVPDYIAVNDVGIFKLRGCAVRADAVAVVCYYFSSDDQCVEYTKLGDVGPFFAGCENAPEGTDT